MNDEGPWLAINLWDLDRVEPTIRQLLLGGKLDLRRETIARVDKDRLDETAVPFACDLLTAACICDTIRAHDRKAGDYPCRVYLRRAMAWEKLPRDAVLTEVVDGKPRLNRDLFAIRIKVETSVPKPQKVQL